MIDLQRSWVSGRLRFTLCMCITIDSASGCPIQMGSSASAALLLEDDDVRLVARVDPEPRDDDFDHAMLATDTTAVSGRRAPSAARRGRYAPT